MLIMKKEIDEKLEADLANIILNEIETEMTEKLLKGNFGATIRNETTTGEYYIAKWTSDDYILKYITEMKGATLLSLLIQIRLFYEAIV